MDQLDHRSLAQCFGQLLSRFREPRIIGLRGDDRHPRRLGLCRDPRSDPAEQRSHQHRKQRTEQKEDEGLRKDRRGEVAAADHISRSKQPGHCAGSSSIAAAAASPAIATKAS
jgi:hypothetical protein